MQTELDNLRLLRHGGVVTQKEYKRMLLKGYIIIGLSSVGAVTIAKKLTKLVRK